MTGSMDQGASANPGSPAPERSRSEHAGPEPAGIPPKLSVVITCWNYSQYVDRAIRSVQSQHREDCELLVVDDGSTDGSWEVIGSTGARALRVDNGGQRKACLHGLHHTLSPFVLFLDADDELLPGSLEAIIANLDDSVAKLQFPLKRMDGDGNIISGPVPELDAFRGRQLVRRVLQTGVYTTPPTSGNVFRRDVCHLLEGAEYDKAVDGVILFAAPFMGDVVSLSQPLGLYRVHDRNDSGLGTELNSQSLRRDLRRFVDRMGHLRQIVETYGFAGELVVPEQAYFYLERRFYLAVAEGERISVQSLLRLLTVLWREYYPARTKAVITAFFLMTSMLPKERARRGLAYRLDAGKRSPLGLLQALI
ncbi:glycosyltransferase family 2 protein [Rhizobium puerariae]|uniref:Glycosyltransferase family 2 protein n=1 Tax=Rhizobium puerariae TaxID=1585791 RepID=A0ABV6ACG7_9HYPH